MRFKLLVGLLLGLASFAAQAELAEHSEQHFIIKHQFNSKKPLAEVYRQFKQVNKWWEAGHTFSGKAENLYFDFDQQRCYCEKLDNGGFIRHLAVIHVQPQKKVESEIKLLDKPDTATRNVNREDLIAPAPRRRARERNVMPSRRHHVPDHAIIR
ncbi:MAG: hypothetical protein MJK04_12985 [Psychrosphaera sp.]|nr:hypothetical protein [Psychrosphaera sp.]